jgi:hypothetical protein
MQGFSMRACSDLLIGCSPSKQQGKNEQYDENKEQDFGYACSARCNAAKTKDGSNNGYDEEDDRPA